MRPNNNSLISCNLSTLILVPSVLFLILLSGFFIYLLSYYNKLLHEDLKIGNNQTLPPVIQQYYIGLANKLLSSGMSLVATIFIGIASVYYTNSNCNRKVTFSCCRGNNSDGDEYLLNNTQVDSVEVNSSQEHEDIYSPSNHTQYSQYYGI